MALYFSYLFKNPSRFLSSKNRLIQPENETPRLLSATLGVLAYSTTNLIRYYLIR